MRFFKYVMPLLAVGGMATSALFGQSSTDENERDIQAVKQFMQSKRAIVVEEKAGNLSIAGDIRFEWQWRHEEHAGADLTGSGSGSTTGAMHGSHRFDVEFNLYMDYTTERTWASVHLEFDNRAGAKDCTDHSTATLAPADGASGECDQICLKRAYFGYNVLEEGTSRFDVELGRRYFYHVFDSRIQFNQRFDGILLRYANTFEGVADFYIFGGAFVIDDVIDHYGWIAEFGFLDIMDWGLDFKYSYLDVDFSKVDRNGNSGKDGEVHQLWAHRNSQWTLAYHFNPEMLRMDVKLYGAFLLNHAAVRRSTTNDKKENMAWYVGVMFGGIKHEGDWSLDVNYQYVEAQAISECDVSGIGRGNVRGQSITMNNAYGNTNYQGFQIEGAYALTDNITVGAEFEWSDDAEDAIGGDHKWRKFELELIYGW